jgi:Tol biopolymer transport system component
MPDVNQLFRAATQSVRPAPGAFARQLEAQRRRARHRKLSALAVAAVVAVGAALFASGVLDQGDDGSAPASVVPTAPRVALTVIDLDGTIRSTTLALPEGAAMPDISPDGSQVAFTIFDQRTELSTVSRITVMNVDGTGSHILTDGRASSVEWPRWSPDGTRLLFLRVLTYRSQQTNGLGYGRLVVMNADGTNAHVIHGTRSLDSQPPAWSPDGTLVLYTSLVGGTQHLEAIPVLGGRSDELTESPHDESQGTWSPDGKSIAFARQVSHDDSTEGLAANLTYQIWMMNADGSNGHPLAAIPDVNAEAPEWSPDGSMIAFIGSTYGIGGAESDSDALYVVNVATGETTKILEGVAIGMGHDSHATWLPNGDALLVITQAP